MNELEALLVARIADDGPMGFDEFVDHALYAPGLGFYTRGGGAGRRRDFLTSPEVGPLFGAVVANALDTWWDDLGRPERYPVVDAGAGPGTLARALIAAAPRCSEALELVLVETAPVQWASHPDGVTSREDLPAPGDLGDGPVVVLANELLDNLPFGLVELTDGGWCEIGVGTIDDASGAPRLAEAFALLSDERAAWCRGKGGAEAPIGTRLPVQAAAAAWLDDALAVAAGGRVVVFDYASTTRDLTARPWTEWVRTYARHGRGGHPLTDPGSQDITVEVAVDQLASVEQPSAQRDQAAFLRAHGIEALVAEGAERWRASGAAGGLAAIAGRSRTHEAQALTDPGGLGAFAVLEWASPGA